MRDVIEVYTEVGKRIQNISDTQRIAVVEGLAGKFHISRMQVLLNDLAKADSMYRSMYESSTNSDGSALRENEIYMKSLEARIALVRVEFEKLAVAIGEAFLSDTMIGFMNTASSLLTLMTEVAKTFGALPIILATLGTALLLISKRFRGVIDNFITFTKSSIDSRKSTTEMTRNTQQMAAGMQNVGDASNKGAQSVGLFGKAMKGLVTGMGVGAALFAVGFVLEKVISLFGQGRKKAEEMASANKALMDSYSANADQIDKLAKKYNELSDSVEGNVTPDIKELAEYRDIQNEIAQLMPSLATGEDEYGKSLIISNDALQVKIALLKEQLEMEKKNAASEEEKKRNENIATYEGDLNSSDRAIASRLNILANIGDSSGGRSGVDKEFIIDFKDSKGNSILDSPEKLLKKLEEVRKLRTNLGENGDPKLTSYYDGLIYSMEMYSKQVGTMNDLQLKTASYLKSEYIPAVEGVIQKNNGLSDSQKEAAAGMSAILLKASDTSNIVQLEDALTKLGESTKSGTMFNTVESIFDTIKNATANNFDQVATNARNSIDSLGFGLEGLGLNADEAKVFMESLHNRLNSNIATQTELDGEMKKTNKTFGEIEASVRGVADGTSEFDNSLGDLKEQFAEFSDISEVMAGVSQKQVDYTNDLILQYERLESTLAGYSDEELSSLEHKKDLTLVETELLNAYNKRNGIMEEMQAIYPTLLSNDAKIVELSHEKLEAIRKENEANQTLITAYKLLAENKLTTEQKQTLYTATETKNRIAILRSEIHAMQQLMNAYQKIATDLSADIDERNKNGMKAMRLSMVMANKDNEYINDVDELIKYQYELDDAIGRIAKTNSDVESSSKAAGKESASSTKESIYISDKYKQALEKVNFELEKQAKLQSKLPEYSDAYLKSLQTQLKLEKEKLALYEKQATSIQSQIASGEIQQTGTISGNSSSSTTSSTTKLSGWNNTKTQGYGGSNGHRGIDLDGVMGERIDANIGGKVLASGDAVKNGYHSSYGNIVVIQDSNGLKHLYAHLQKAIVKLGDTIEAGTQIGTIGNTGRVISGSGDGSHLHYEVIKNGATIDPSGYIKDAQAGNITKTTSSTADAISTVSTTQEAIDNAQSELLAIRSEILNQQDAITALEERIINAPLLKLERQKNVIQDNLDYEAEKIKNVDKSSARYVKTLNLQTLYLEQKQNVNKQELAYIEKMIKSGTLSSKMLDEYKDRLLAVKTEMIANTNAMSEMAMAMLDVYEFQRIEPNSILEYENAKIKEVDTNSVRYVKTLDRMSAAMKEKQKVNQKELAYLKEQITSGKHSGEGLEKLKDRYSALTTEIKQLSIELKDMNYDIIINISTQYDEKMSNLQYEIDRSKIIQSLYEAQSDNPDKEMNFQSEDIKKEIRFQIEATNKLREETLRKIEDIQASLLNYELNPDKVKQLNAELQQASLSYQQLGLDVLNLNKSIADTEKKEANALADKLIAAYKSYIEERKDAHMKALDKEVKAENKRHETVLKNYQEEIDLYKKLVDEKLKSLDRESNERSYNQEMDDLTKERTDLIRRIDLLSLDDSYEATAKRKELQDALAKIDRDIADKQYDRNVELQKQELQDALDRKEEEVNKKEELEDSQHQKELDRLDELKDYWEKHYTDLLNDERKFSAIRQAILKGDFDALETEFGEYLTYLKDTMPELQDTFDGTMQAVGMSIRQNLIDSLDEALRLMQQLKNAEVITGEFGSSADMSGGTSSSSNMKLGDMQVLLGKFMTDVLRNQASTTAEKNAIGDEAHRIAALGRQNNSTISKDIDYQSYLTSMSKADIAALANFFSQNAGSMGISSILQDVIRNEANKLAVGSNNYAPPSSNSSSNNQNTESTKTLSQGDKQVLLAKYMKDVLAFKANDTSTRDTINATADKTAKAGRANNSSINSSLGFSDAIRNYSKSELRSLGAFMQSNADIIANTTLKQELLKYANSLASLDTGGMTKNWGAFGGVDGKGARFGLLHPEEIITNPLDSKRLLSMANVLERTVSFLSPSFNKMANFSKQAFTGDSYVVHFGDVLNSTQGQAENFATSFVNKVRVKKGGK